MIDMANQLMEEQIVDPKMDSNMKLKERYSQNVLRKDLTNQQFGKSIGSSRRRQDIPIKCIL